MTLLISATLALTRIGASAAQPPGTTQFRLDVDLVTVDVTVLDGQGTPVPDLRAADVVVRVDGAPRRVVSMQYVDAQSHGGVEKPASPHGGPPSASPGTGRRFVFAVDWDGMVFGRRRQVLDAAMLFADGLSPADRSAVWVVPKGQGQLTFTHDARSIKDALNKAFGSAESFEAMQMVPVEATMIDRGLRTMEGLRDLARALAPLDGPTHVLFITAGVVQHRDVIRKLSEAAGAAASGRVHVHVLQPWSRTWVEPAQQTAPDESAPNAIDLSAASSLALTTGGHASTYVAPQTAFARLARELGGSYLLAFEPLPSDRDGRVHPIEVAVTGRGQLTVRARQQFRIEPHRKASTGPAAAAAPAAATASPERPSTEPVGPSSDLDALLGKVRAYIAGFERDLASVVLEERYIQVAKPWIALPKGPEHEPALSWATGDAKQANTVIFATRRLVSDVLLVQASHDMWIGFRDVFEVDGRAVRRRDDRLKRLFLSRPAGRNDELWRVSHESARYNLGLVARTINVPTFPLLYLHTRHAGRMRFSLKRAETVDGRACAVLEFREVGRPTLVGTPQGGHVRAWGRAWIEPDTGRVRRIEARVEPDARRQCVRVTFGDHPGLDALVPVEMWEWYERAPIIGHANDIMIEALARYSNVRRFTVNTSESLGPQ